jgi:hypothetical protein
LLLVTVVRKQTMEPKGHREHKLKKRHPFMDQKTAILTMQVLQKKSIIH